MKYLLTGIIICCIAMTAMAQHNITFIIKGGEQKEALAGATITWKEQNRSVLADSSGKAGFNNVPAGAQTFIISHVSFGEKTLTYTFPLASNEAIEIEM